MILIYNDFIMQNTNDLIWVIDSDLNTVNISKSIERVTEFTDTDYKNKKITNYVNQKSNEDIFNLINNKNNENEGKIPLTFICNSQKKIYSEAYFRKEQINNNNLLVLLIKGSDVNCIHKKNKIEKQKNEMVHRFKSYLLNILNHEFKTPLIGILGYTNLLFNDSLSDDNIEMVREIHSSALRLHATLNSVTTLAALDGEQYNLKIEKVHLKETIENVISNYIPMLKSKDIDYKINCDNKTNLETDENFLHQILFHIFDNSVKFTNYGSINIDVQRNNTKIQIIISDTGIGIEKDMLDSIYEPFRQASEGHNRDYDGIGLGLTITEKLVKALHGNIQIESQFSEGTIVKLDFPIKYSSKKTPSQINQEGVK
jgi:signal transduction histidine kinase